MGCSTKRQMHTFLPQDTILPPRQCLVAIRQSASYTMRLGLWSPIGGTIGLFKGHSGRRSSRCQDLHLLCWEQAIYCYTNGQHQYYDTSTARNRISDWTERYERPGLDRYTEQIVLEIMHLSAMVVKSPWAIKRHGRSQLT